jgi:hypothetical protein
VVAVAREAETTGEVAAVPAEVAAREVEVPRVEVLKVAL